MELINLVTDFKLYWFNILNFVSTLVIKSEYMVDYYNRIYYNLPSLNLDDPTTFPYYINLAGIHHEFNTDININFYDSTITINKDNIYKYKYLIEYFYYYPNVYNNLLNTYKNQQLLIKSLLFTNNDYTIQDVIDLPNYTLLGYNDKFLDIQEKSYIINSIKNFLSYCNDRWHVKFFNYEELYGISFDSMLYMILPLVILYYKIQAIKTSNVDDFHLWEYLLSKGLINFKQYFTKYQSLYFYKNIDYLIANKGKIQVIKILKELLLDPLGISLESLINLHYLSSFISNPSEWNNILGYKDLLSSKNINDTKVKYTNTFYEFNDFLYNNKLERINTKEYVDKIKKTFKYNKYNSIITKFQKFNIILKIDYKYYLYYLMYIHDTLVYLLQNDKIDFYIYLQNDINKKDFIYISVKDVYYLIYYCFYKFNNITPKYLPKYHTYKYTLSVFNQENIDNIIPSIFKIKQVTYLNKDLIDIEYIKDNIDYLDNYPYKKITTSDEFKKYLENNYNKSLLYILLKQRRVNSIPIVQAHDELFIKLFNSFKTDTINFNNFSTYEEYFNSNIIIKKFIDIYDKNKNKYYYLDLIVTMFEKISLLDENFRKLFYSKRSEINYYKLLMQLFEFLGSYRTRMIKSDVQNYTYIFTSFKYIETSLISTTYESKLIYPSKGVIIKMLNS